MALALVSRRSVWTKKEWVWRGARGLFDFTRVPEKSLFNFTRKGCENPLDKTELSRTLTEEEMGAVEDASIKWIMTTDEEIGGESACDVKISPEEGGKLVFSGVVSTKRSRYEEINRTGFCSMRAYLRETDVEDFDAIEIIFKSDGSPFAFNIKPVSYIPDDLYQGFLITDAANKNQWCRALLPFDMFMLTGRGHVKEDQRDFDYNFVDFVGFTISAAPGPFSLELKTIKIVNTSLIDF